MAAHTELIEQTKQYLFASEDEMREARLPQPVQQRLLRLREQYAYWLRWPRLTDRDIVDELRRRHGLGLSQAYEDVRLIKVCLGALNQVTKDYDRWLFRQRLEEGYKMAREQQDAKAFASMLTAHGKFARLDQNEADAPAYSDIVPQSFEPVGDPTAAGIRPAKNWRERARALEQKFKREAMDADYEEITEQEPDNNKTQP